MYSFFDWLFHGEYYQIGCIIAAYFLCITAIDNRRLVFFVLFCEFFFIELAYVIGMHLSDRLTGASLYIVYSIIQFFGLFFMWALSRSGRPVSFLIALTLAFTSLYNAFIASTFYGYTVFGFSGIEMYNIYVNLFGFIMLLQLVYMLFYNKFIIARLGPYARAYTIFIDRICFSSNRHVSWGLE